MPIPKIPAQPLIPLSEVETDSDYQGLRIVRTQTNQESAEKYESGRFQFQHQFSEYVQLKATLTRKGIVGGGKERIVVTVHPRLQDFVEIVQYDPANPPMKDYNAYQMSEAHKRTQADFKGAKAKNREDFRDYVLEGIGGERILFLPSISGWQSETVFSKTVFVAFDEEDPEAMYGMLFLPKAPVMQADGQTQTAALFAAAKTPEAIEGSALSSLRVTLEIELNVDQNKAGQSFADRNGRGSKKNKNLVIALDTSAAVSQLRALACQGTIFENRLADGRSTGTGMTHTTNIVDLSAMEQMILLVACGGTKKPEHFKHFHVHDFLPFVKEFLEILESTFGEEWPKVMKPNEDTYRRVYVHGWAFALKALAKAYHRVRVVDIEPLAMAVGADAPGETAESAYKAAVEKNKAECKAKPDITLDEFKKRLKKIDWKRHRKHWIAITGASEKDGKQATIQLKNGEVVVRAQAPNTAAVIDKVAKRILSDQWEQLTSDVDQPIK